MGDNSIAGHELVVLSFTREVLARWIRRLKHMRRHPLTKVSLAAKRLFGGPDYISELIFWENVLESRPAWMSDKQAKARAFPPYLRSHLATIAEAGDRPVRVLEVGSGPVSILADGVDEGLIAVTAVDPLASLYAMLLREQGIDYPIAPVESCGERLSEQFEENRFDIVYSSNALDHTDSPRRCLTEMNSVVNTGGLIVLEGFEREGSNAQWAGLHQHDLVPEDGHMIRYDRHGRRENVTEGLGMQCIHTRVVQFKDRTIHGFGYELPPDVPLDADWKWNLRNWYTVVFQKL